MKELKLNQNTGINLPIGNLISIIGACLVAAWFGFSIIERVNKLETQTVLMEKDLEKAVEFSIKWPRGELGSLPADAQQDLLIEFMSFWAKITSMNECGALGIQIPVFAIDFL